MEEEEVAIMVFEKEKEKGKKWRKRKVKERSGVDMMGAAVLVMARLVKERLPPRAAPSAFTPFSPNSLPMITQ